MFFKSFTIIGVRHSVIASSSTLRIAFVTAAIFFALTVVSFAAVFPGYTFLTVSGSGSGNSTNTQFSGTNGVINVSHLFSAGGAGGADNNNFLSGFHPGQFTTTFPGTGLVQGHLAQTVYNHTSAVTFDLTGYTITPDTAFGMWNTTDEVTRPPGGPPVYQVQLIDASNLQVNPTTFFHMGNQDNQTQVQGRHSLVLNTSTGEVAPGGTINGGVGTHTDAAFWKNIPTTTKKIIVYGILPPLNTIGDGVGYYFAELVPEPCGLATAAVGLYSIAVLGWRRKR